MLLKIQTGFSTFLVTDQPEVNDATLPNGRVLRVTTYESVKWIMYHYTVQDYAEMMLKAKKIPDMMLRTLPYPQCVLREGQLPDKPTFKRSCDILTPCVMDTFVDRNFTKLIEIPSKDLKGYDNYYTTLSKIPGHKYADLEEQGKGIIEQVNERLKSQHRFTEQELKDLITPLATAFSVHVSHMLQFLQKHDLDFQDLQDCNIEFWV
jgi:hypothetical protein